MARKKKTKTKAKKEKLVNEQVFDIIRRPVVTEKSTLLGEQNKITFLVGVDASKYLYDGDRPVPITDNGKPITKLFS